MLKTSVTYEDFDGETVTDTLYFNVTKTELADNLDLQDELDRVQKQISGEPRQLNSDEIKMILDIVKRLLKLSYGIRSEDGKRFIKSDTLWEEFTQTAAYDAYLFSMFEEPAKAVAFMKGILPASLRTEVAQQFAELEEQMGTSQDAPVAPEIKTDEDEVKKLREQLAQLRGQVTSD